MIYCKFAVKKLGSCFYNVLCFFFSCFLYTLFIIIIINLNCVPMVLI